MLGSQLISQKMSEKLAKFFFAFCSLSSKKVKDESLTVTIRIMLPF